MIILKLEVDFYLLKKIERQIDWVVEELTTDASANAAVINHASLRKHNAYCRYEGWKNQFLLTKI